MELFIEDLRYKIYLMPKAGPFNKTRILHRFWLLQSCFDLVLRNDDQVNREIFYYDYKLRLREVHK